MLVFWAVTPFGLVNVSEEHTISIFSSEDGSIMFLRSVGMYLLVHTALQPRRPTPTSSPRENLKSLLRLLKMNVEKGLIFWYFML
jgi:hypothetical protein